MNILLTLLPQVQCAMVCDFSTPYPHLSTLYGTYCGVTHTHADPYLCSSLIMDVEQLHVDICANLQSDPMALEHLSSTADPHWTTSADRFPIVTSVLKSGLVWFL